MAEDFRDRVLNRKPKNDWRNLRLENYITDEMRLKAAAVTSKVWKVSKILDQGQTGHCVGFAWSGYGISEPVEDVWGNDEGDEIYYAAKIIDGEPGQEDGSSTLSGVKAFMQFGQLQGNKYAWASNIEDLKVWVLTQSPVVVGTDWHYNMFNPDSKGQVYLGGGVAGGHEYQISGYDRKTDLFLATNSWGMSWANSGQFYISAADLQTLMNAQGDACTAVEISAPVPVPPGPTPQPVPVPNDNQWLIDLLNELLTIKGLPAWVKNVIKKILASIGG